jgi:hypothetical protein
MPVSSPEVTIENIIQNGFADIVANASTYIPLILANFPTDYRTDAIAYLTGPNFKINTFFGYAYDTSEMPVFNIVLSSESEGTGASRQMYLGDIVEAADDNPNTQDYEQFGSMWSASISVIVRCQKARQTIILYALTKWLMLKNRVALETAGIMATKFSGSDLVYDKTKEPTFTFARTWKMDCLVFNTYDLDITSDPTLLTVVSAFNSEVRGLPQEQEES